MTSDRRFIRRGASTGVLPAFFLLHVLWTATGVGTAAASSAGNAAAPAESGAGESAEQIPSTRHSSMPKTSVIRFETRISLADIEARVDARIPRTTGSPDRFITYNDSLEIRYAVDRDSVKLVLDGIDFKLTFHTRYWLHLRGRNGYDIAEARCGTPEEPIGIAMGYRGRIGWDDGWKLGIRLEPEADIFALRCKPIPPGHNFTRFLERTVQNVFHEAAGAAFTDEVERFDGIRPLIESAWGALHEPQDIFERQVWIRWAPVRIEADPIGGEGNGLDLRVSFITNPSMYVGEPGTFAIAALPDPVVRISESNIRLPVDITLPLAGIGEHVAARLGTTEFAAVKRVHVEGAGRDIVVDVSSPADPQGALLAGSLGFDADTAAVEVQALDWVPGGLDSFRKCYPDLDAAAFVERLRSELAFDVREELIARRQLLPRAVNRTFGPLVAAHGAITHFLAEDPVVAGPAILIRHWALGPMWLDVSPVYGGGGIATPRHESPRK